MEKELKKYLKNGEFSNVKESTSKIMSSIKGKGNKSTELKFRMALVRAHISGWEINVKILPGKPDFYFPNHRIAIFIDGCYWHGCPIHGHIPKTRSDFWKAKIEKNIDQDRNNCNKLKEMEIVVFRFWELEIKDNNGLEKVINSLKMQIST